MPKHPALDTGDAVRQYVREQLGEAVRDARHGWHWPALTTGGHSRIVVLRALDEGGAEVTWYTDRRSDKVEQLARDGHCSLLFNNAAHRTQLRLRGRAHEDVDEQVRRTLWAGISPGAKSNYATLQAPGTPLSEASTGLPPAWPKLDAATEARAFAHFAVYRTRVTSGDFLQLLDEGAYRSRWDGEGFRFVTP